jgi:hypothetical protein
MVLLVCVGVFAVSVGVFSVLDQDQGFGDGSAGVSRPVNVTSYPTDGASFLQLRIEDQAIAPAVANETRVQVQGPERGWGEVCRSPSVEGMECEQPFEGGDRWGVGGRVWVPCPAGERVGVEVWVDERLVVNGGYRCP